MSEENDKILHISPELHGRFKRHCNYEDVRMKDVVEGLLEKHLENIVPVERRARVDIAEGRELNPFANPPFWKTRRS